MKILVLGDLIVDKYRMCMATRLCPEGPVPVLVEDEGPREIEKSGGAGLVAEQFKALAGEDSVVFIPGSISHKERIFADDRLMLRIDRDSDKAADRVVYRESIEDALAYKLDAIIVSDYGKGSFDYELGTWLIQRASDLSIPVFVDAKTNWFYYCNCFAMFPNKKEGDAAYQFVTKHVIKKLGPDGCEVDGVHIPTNSHPVRDCTGAGDVFIAAFVYKYLQLPYSEGFETYQYSDEGRLLGAAKFANKVAGISVEFVGTHVVTKEEIENRVDDILNT